MKTQPLFFLAIYIIVLSFVSCNGTGNSADGYGNFEAVEVTISAENNGKLMSFNLFEGDILEKNQFLGYIDTIPLYLSKKQLTIGKALVREKSRGVLSQIEVLNAKLQTAVLNKNRIEKLISENAATQKQLDDILGEIAVIQKQIKSIEIQNAPVVNELKNIDVQIEQIEDKIQKSKIYNPISGTVLVKYAEENEIVNFGKPLYKIADLTALELRIYISETQLSTIKIGQEVTVKIDQNNGTKSYAGKITWVASEAEFTPKIIQTKEERVALVYAVKVAVLNDGDLKIGMPAEVYFN
jgi:HlyD family secretion protein